jgi:acyl-CoA dehydrogenase
LDTHVPVETTGSFQDPPRLRDEWEDDLALRRYVARVLPDDVRAEVEPELAELGLLAATELKELSDRLDRREAEPRLVPFDAWGRRVDRIEVAPEWDRLTAIGQERGVVATGYERTHGEHARVHQFALAYLFSPSSGLVSCPFAMTDGAAATLLAHGDRELIDRAVPRLTSRDPEDAWTSGQWMTERPGGSDVGRAETVATQDGGVWRLTGTKWFTSAVTSDVALALARPEGNGPGGRGLAMFYLEVRDDTGALNHLRVLRLKDKLGTRQLPTAELALEGTVAHLVGTASDGTRNITPMLAITRLWNAVTAAGYLRRGLALARDHARRREAFGAAIVDQPAHQATLAWLRVQHEAALQLTFRTVELLGREEAGAATDAERLTLRALLPITKLTTGKQAVAGTSEALEAFGGAGYVEDTHLPGLLRDSQVLPIWEGTTNVLALDLLRALGHDEGTFAALAQEVRRAATTTEHQDLARLGQQAIDAVDHAGAWLRAAADAGRPATEHGARRLAVTLGRSLQLALLAQQAQHDLTSDADGRGLAVARRFAGEGIDLLEEPGVAVESDAALARDEPIAP